ncbi:uncharacterized protein EDB91DRAFT_1140784 [Suillus paluster]|uniref:uncharacterized protein n=1 Tax=Suillus paluster TaxID=48578 RepID=UPI001B8621BC|nr:uncharacterized protein EDB91DRAFT_1140784 [Suillus paluster]KAG1737576.1 hypothetical protein EDB91DRAFT_1140784 [Suillus paluster]
MARTRVGGKRKGPRDPTKEAHIQAVIRDTLTWQFSQCCADNPRFSALYGSKRRTGRPVAIANPTSSESSTPSASTSLPTAANNMFHPDFSANAKISPHSVSKPLTSCWPRSCRGSYLRHHSHCCLDILVVAVYITLTTHNTYSIRLLHTSHSYTRTYLPNV